MMAIEQAYMGFNRPDGTLISVPQGKVDLQTGKKLAAGAVEDKRQNWWWLNLDWSKSQVSPIKYNFTTYTFDVMLERVRAFKIYAEGQKE